MVWKSERWQTLLEVVGDAEVGRPVVPDTLEITYSRGDGQELVKEDVYEDLNDKQHQPRLLVSLSAVTALKELCEHEHARCDKILQTLTKCRAAYYKELRWLRDQLHLAYQTDEEAMARKAALTPDDFEVYWFEPPNYVDPETRDFLLKCIRETNRRLINENNQLRSELMDRTILDSAIMPTVIRRLRKEYATGSIVRELYSQLRTKLELQDFEETVAQLLGSPVAAHAKGPLLEPDADAHVDAVSAEREHERAAMQEELQLLRQKTQEQEAMLCELRSQLSSGIDAQLERDRAEAERQRAELALQQAEELAQQRMALQEQRDRGGPADAETATRRVYRSAAKIREAMLALIPAGTAPSSPCTSPKARRVASMGQMSLDEDEVSFEEALSQMELVSTGCDAVVRDAIQELKDLRAKVALLEAMNQATPNGEGALKSELKALQAKLEEALAKLGEERAMTEQLRQQLAEAQEETKQAQHKLGLARVKLGELREKLKVIRAVQGLPPSESDDEDDDELQDVVTDYMTPYRKRVLASVGKSRWELLAEDAACRRQRDVANEQRLRGNGNEAPHEQLRRLTAVPQQDEAEVMAAFHFLSVRRNTVASHGAGRGSASHNMAVLRQLQQQQQQHQQASMHQQLAPARLQVLGQEEASGRSSAGNSHGRAISPSPEGWRPASGQFNPGSGQLAAVQGAATADGPSWAGQWLVPSVVTAPVQGRPFVALPSAHQHEPGLGPLPVQRLMSPPQLLQPGQQHTPQIRPHHLLQQPVASRRPNSRTPSLSGPALRRTTLVLPFSEAARVPVTSDEPGMDGVSHAFRLSALSPAPTAGRAAETPDLARGEQERAQSCGLPAAAVHRGAARPATQEQPAGARPLPEEAELQSYSTFAPAKSSRSNGTAEVDSQSSTTASPAWQEPDTYAGGATPTRLAPAPASPLPGGAAGLTGSADLPEAPYLGSPALNFRPARSLRLAAQSSVQSPFTRSASTLPLADTSSLQSRARPSLQKGHLGTQQASLPDFSATAKDWLAPRCGSGVPLTNANRMLRTPVRH